MSDYDSTKDDGGHRARGLVNWAKSKGAIPSPTDFSCADCGRPAEVYDHRDYGRPLDVVAVCQRCNVARGAARPAEPRIVPATKQSVGYAVDPMGVRGVSFEVVAFDEEPLDWPAELAQHLENAPTEKTEADTPTLWGAWK